MLPERSPGTELPPELLARAAECAEARLGLSFRGGRLADLAHGMASAAAELGLAGAAECGA